MLIFCPLIYDIYCNYGLGLLMHLGLKKLCRSSCTWCTYSVSEKFCNNLCKKMQILSDNEMFARVALGRKLSDWQGWSCRISVMLSKFSIFRQKCFADHWRCSFKLVSLRSAISSTVVWTVQLPAVLVQTPWFLFKVTAVNFRGGGPWKADCLDLWLSLVYCQIPCLTSTWLPLQMFHSRNQVCLWTCLDVHFEFLNVNASKCIGTLCIILISLLRIRS